MMKPEDVKQQAEQLFTKRSPLLSLWQTIAEHFYPERADFTNMRNMGEELADNLLDSYPLLVRRDLGDSLHSMLRDGNWFDMTTEGESPDYAGKDWLEFAVKRMRNQYDTRRTGFVRAMKQGDHDYIAFGQPVISVEMNRTVDGLLFRNWHLRDCAWFEDDAGMVAGLFRRWKPTANDMKNLFGDKCHEKVLKMCNNKQRFETVSCLHACIPTEMYDDESINADRFPYVSITIDCDHDHLIEAIPKTRFMYVVPRFQTVTGSQYAYSPATTVALPNARLIQAMTFTLLEAGERYTRPPMTATAEVIRGDVDLASDGITWIDPDYDQRTGSALQPIPFDKGGFPIGFEMRGDVKETIASAFYLNRLSLPPINKEMTAYEVQERMKQFRREALPLFAPMESEYNGAICELAFDIMFENGLLGSPADVPQSLQGTDVIFKFKSPLTDEEKERRADQFRQTANMIREVADIAPDVGMNANLDVAFRDALDGIGAPNNWKLPEDLVMQRKEAVAMQKAAMAEAQA